jgi:hypothetical protein
LANVGESEQNRLANVGESGESGTFPKKAILASTQICQKWQISGEYSNSINLLSSGHCLDKTLKLKNSQQTHLKMANYRKSYISEAILEFKNKIK